MVPKRWRDSAPDATSFDVFGPASAFAAAQVAWRLQNWPDQDHVPPLIDRGTPSGAPTPAPADTARKAAANRIIPT